MNYLKKFESFVDEAPVKEPETTPKTKPKKPSPIKRKNPSVKPNPKAEVDEIINKFLDTASDEDKKEVLKNYEN